MKRIEFGELQIGEVAKQHLMDVCDTNWASGGPKVKQLEKSWSELFDYERSVATSSGTDGCINSCLSLYDLKNAKRNVSEVIVDMKSYEKDYKVFDKTTATGKGIWIFADKSRDIEITRKGIQQSGWSADDLPFYVKNYICYDRQTDKRWNFDKNRKNS